MLILLNANKEFSIQMGEYIRRKERERRELNKIRYEGHRPFGTCPIPHVTFDELKAAVTFLNVYQRLRH